MMPWYWYDGDVILPFQKLSRDFMERSLAVVLFTSSSHEGIWLWLFSAWVNASCYTQSGWEAIWNSFIFFSVRFHFFSLILSSNCLFFCMNNCQPKHGGQKHLPLFTIWFLINQETLGDLCSFFAFFFQSSYTRTRLSLASKPHLAQSGLSRGLREQHGACRCRHVDPAQKKIFTNRNRWWDRGWDSAVHTSLNIGKTTRDKWQHQMALLIFFFALWELHQINISKRLKRVEVFSRPIPIVKLGHSSFDYTLL
jgi:hypothetical protein